MQHLEEHTDLLDKSSPPSWPAKKPTATRLFPWSVALNLGLLVALAVVASRDSLWLPERIVDSVYSPAQDAVSYKTVVFTGGLRGDKPVYQGDSPEVNARWEALYNDIGMSQIPQTKARLLPNATTPIAGDPTQAMVELDVFHQLHCLNMMRKLVYPATFALELTPGTPGGDDTIYHMEHCYDQLRQAIQCHGDTSTIFWEWSEPKQRMFGNLRTTHTCRDFGRLQEWARAHRLQEPFDQFKRVEGAPLRQEA